jgi:adenosine kinase
MARADTLSIREIPGEGADLVTISPNAPDAMAKYVSECQELGIPYLYDPSQQIVRLATAELQEGIKGAAILVANEYEFRLLQERTGLSDDAIRACPAQAAIVTLGSQGAQVWADGECYQIPAVPPERIDDPTGVGDAFRAGLVRGLGLGLPWALAGRVGALAATYVLEKPGAQGHRYTRSEFVARFREHFDDIGALDALLTGDVVQ